MNRRTYPSRRGSRTIKRLRILAISDLRVQPLDLLLEWVARLRPRLDLICYAGDDVSRFRPDLLDPEGLNYWKALAACARFGLVAVLGNDDHPDLSPPIKGPKAVDGEIRGPVRLGQFAVLGVGGSEAVEGEPNPGYIVRTATQIRKILVRQRRAAAGRAVILISHAPPRGILDDAVRFSAEGRPRPIGSLAVAEAVERWPELRLVVCGHVHLHGGRDTQAGSVAVVNAASHDSPRSPTRAALIVVTPKRVESIEWHTLRFRPDFEMVWGLGMWHVRRLRAGGIPDTLALASVSPDVVGRALGWRPRSGVPLIARARAIVEQRAIPFDELHLADGPRVYIDIETDLGEGVVVVGALDEASGQFTSLLATKQHEERLMLLALAQLLSSSKRPVVACSGSRFDERLLAGAYRRWRLPIPEAIGAAEDAHIAFQRTLAFPLRSWTVGGLAKWCGAPIRHPALDGFAVGIACLNARRGEGQLSQQVFEKNEDDVRALAAMVARVEAVVRETPIPDEWQAVRARRRARPR